MTRYVVEPTTVIKANGLPRAQKIDYLKEEVAKVVGIIAAYNKASAADNRVEVKETAWINATVMIEASDIAAANLAMTTGLKVGRPKKLTRG